MPLIILSVVRQLVSSTKDQFYGRQFFHTLDWGWLWCELSTSHSLQTLFLSLLLHYNYATCRDAGSMGESWACLPAATQFYLEVMRDTQNVQLMFRLLQNFTGVAITAENLASQMLDVGNGRRLAGAFVAISG